MTVKANRMKSSAISRQKERYRRKVNGTISIEAGRRFQLSPLSFICNCISAGVLWRSGATLIWCLWDLRGGTGCRIQVGQDQPDVLLELVKYNLEVQMVEMTQLLVNIEIASTTCVTTRSVWYSISDKMTVLLMRVNECGLLPKLVRSKLETIGIFQMYLAVCHQGCSAICTRLRAMTVI